MKTRSIKNKDDKSRSVANSVAQNESKGKKEGGFVDNRSDVISQRQELSFPKIDKIIDSEGQNMVGNHSSGSHKPACGCGACKGQAQPKQLIQMMQSGHSLNLLTQPVQLVPCDCGALVNGPAQGRVEAERATIDAGFPLAGGQRRGALITLQGALNRSIQARQDVLASHTGGCAGRPGHQARVVIEQGYRTAVNADIALIGARIPTTAWAQAVAPNGDWTRTMAHYNRDPLHVETRTNGQHQDVLGGWSIA